MEEKNFLLIFWNRKKKPSGFFFILEILQS